MLVTVETMTHSPLHAGPLGGTGFMYGIDVVRFRDADGDGMGDLRGVIDRLDHVASLGATWIWLLPFYPSPRRDNGYDVEDHTAVDPRLGSIDDVERLVEQAHRRGIRVMIDLVVHHTSDQHPWFLASKAGDPAYAEHYVWRPEPQPPQVDPPMFEGEQTSAWSHSSERGLWYRHAFYDFMPDLNHDAEGVRESLFAIAQHWVGLGIDGFRVDAASHVTRAQAPDEPSLTFFAELRRRLDAVRPGVVIMGEADLPPAETTPLLRAGGFDALLGFSLNNRIALALAREDARPITDMLEQLRGPGQSAWVNFLRNNDELDLEQLSDEERTEVMDRFAPTRDQRLYGRGIRRALAPMLSSARLLRASMSLLFALPGFPLVMAGQEIGAGDDLSVPGRAAVRLAMQWDDSPSGGFSAAGASPFVRPAQMCGPFGIPARNVAAAERDPESLLHLLRSLAAQPRPTSVTAQALPAADPVAPVLVMTSAEQITVHHLGSQPVEVPAVLGPHRLGPFTGGPAHGGDFGWFGAT